MISRTWALAAVSVMFAVAGCGGSSSSSSKRPTAPGFYIQIVNLTFSPVNLAAPPGATITVLNDDSIQHTVTSEAMAGAYTPGAVAGVSFDTGPIMGNMSFTLPASVPNHTVIPFFCNIHKATMNTPNGSITIDSTAQPHAPPPAPGGGGGGY